MAWRLTSLHYAQMTQFAVDWALVVASLLIALPTVWTVSKTTTAEDEAGYDGPRLKLRRRRLFNFIDYSSHDDVVDLARDNGWFRLTTF